MTDHLNDDDDDDDIGFSLIMKDLLADLAVNVSDDSDANHPNHHPNDNWLSLDLLEQELKQLESSSSHPPQFLHHYDDYSTNVPSTAAGMVVHSQAASALQQQQLYQAFQSPMGLIPSVPVTTSMDYNNHQNSAMDAWSLSLQKFTASSLEADFLLADSARKQQTTTTTTLPPPPNNDVLQFADYNVQEGPVVAPRPPPGITPDASQQMISQAAAKLVQQLQQPQPPTSVAMDPIFVESEPRQQQQKEEEEGSNEETMLVVNQLTRNLQRIHEHQALITEPDDGDDTTGLPTPPLHVPRPVPMTPQNSVTLHRAPNTTINSSSSSSSSSGNTKPLLPEGSVIMSAPTPMPTPVVTKPLNTENMAATTMAAPPVYPTMTTPSVPPPLHHPHPPVMPIMAVPLPPTMAWQAPPPQMMMMMMPPPPMPPPQRPVFANPHPTATPIPATALASQYMTARDIAFVVHGMLKPILMSENLGTMSTYHLQYWTRHHPVKPPPPPATKRRMGDSSDEETKLDVVSAQLQARHVKTKEWASERKVLGSTGKTDVTRPRALIAISSSTILKDTANDGVASMKQQRAALWKSRIYCDQAYQCYTAVMDHRWQGPSSSTSVQPHLLKLTKCLGIAVQTVLVDTATGQTITPTAGTVPTEDEGKQFRNQYSVDSTVLELLFKLAKGKILMARVLDDALLPPSVVQVLLPVALPILFAAPISTTDDDVAMADDRVLGAWTVVIDTLPTISSVALLETVRAIMKQQSANHNSILSTTDRMQCTHALLQRGAAMAANDPTLASDWQETETQFLEIISNL